PRVKKKKKSGKKRKSGAISGTPGVNVASGQEGGTNEEEEEEAAPPKEIGPTMPKKLKSVESNGNKANGSLDVASTLPIHQQITSSSPISCLYEYCKKGK
ncbi:Doublestranded RNAbinding protein Staufen -like protein 2like, partial [Caligus rogercresseyi]